jgi:hypothetical protein
MTAHDLLRAIALDPLRTLVPTRHVTGWVQQEDGIVPDAFHKETEPLFACPQLSRDGLRLGKQTGVANGQVDDHVGLRALGRWFRVPHPNATRLGLLDNRQTSLYIMGVSYSSLSSLQISRPLAPNPPRSQVQIGRTGAAGEFR